MDIEEQSRRDCGPESGKRAGTSERLRAIEQKVAKGSLAIFRSSPPSRDQGGAGREAVSALILPHHDLASATIELDFVHQLPDQVNPASVVGI